MRSSLLLGGVAAILAWPLAYLAPGPGLDPAWQLGLHMAADGGLHYGDQIVFTYGPLGFLHVPVIAFRWTYRMAFLFGALAHVAVCWALVACLLRARVPALAALLVVAIIASFFQIDTELVLLAFAGAVAALTQEGWSDRRWMALGVAGGGLAAIELLAKLSVGVTVLGLLVICVVAAPGDRRRRFAVTSVAAFVLVGIAFWFASGQSIGNIPAYALTAVSVVSGYSAAMIPSPELPPGLAPLLLVAAALFAGAVWVTTRDLPRGRRIAILLLAALLLFTTYKAAIVRPDRGHLLLFLPALTGALLALRWQPKQRVIAGLCVALSLMTCLAAINLPPGQTPAGLGEFIRPGLRIENAVDQVELAVSTERQSEVVNQSRATMAAAWGIDPATIAAVGAEPVHIAPVEASVAWVFGLRWRPLPVFQSYVAYTERLDELNADAASGDAGPTRMLVQNTPLIEGRQRAFESPAAQVATLCHFRAVSTTAAWQVLARVPDRCGPERTLGRVDAAYGDTVRVPPARPGEAVITRVEGAQVGGLERLQALLYRADIRQISVNGKPPFRLIPGTVADGLVVAVPPRADFPAPFGLGLQARTLQVTRGTSPEQDGELTYAFSAVPVGAVPQARLRR